MVIYIAYDKSPRLREESRMSIMRPKYQTSNPNSSDVLEEIIREEVNDEDKKAAVVKTKLSDQIKDEKPKADGGLLSRFFAICC